MNLLTVFGEELWGRPTLASCGYAFGLQGSCVLRMVAFTPPQQIFRGINKTTHINPKALSLYHIFFRLSRDFCNFVKNFSARL
jgi:hypothetical protein